jgi:beta-lactamase class A
MKFLSNRKFTVLQLGIFCGAAIVITFIVTDFWKKHEFQELSSQVSPPVCKTDIKTLEGLKYIRPIMFVDAECESDDLLGLKQRISEIIQRYQANHDANSASFYLKKNDNNDWTSLNEEEEYMPGSLYKVPILIAILKMNEMNPGFLNMQVIFNKKFDIERDVVYNAKSIEFGKTYSIKELLTYMIQYSDNNATVLLHQHMKPEVYRKVFEDFGLKAPVANSQPVVSVKEYSYFMKAIYNAAYLNIDDSEYAAELLTLCNFKDGIVKGIPLRTPIAHKFGESGDTSEKQLHESGIVYLDGNSYLLTIMTKGKDNKKLSELIAEISQAVYLEISSQPTTVM